MITLLASLTLLPASLTPLHQAPPTQEKQHSHAVVRGVFVDSNDEPVEGVEFLSRVWPGAEFKVISDSHGKVEVRVEWAAHKDDTWYQGIARVLGHAKWEKRGNLKSGEEFDLGKIQLAPGGAVSGRVVGVDGKPLGEAHVRVIDAHQTPRPEVFASQTDSGSEEWIDSGKTNADGSFQVVGLPPGKYWLIGKHESTWRQASETIAVVAGEEVAVGELRLEPLPDSYRIEGSVLGPEGKPVGCAEVSTSVHAASGRSLIRTAAKTDEAGRFVLYLARLPNEPVQLRVVPSSKELDEVSLDDIRPGARGIVVKLGGMRMLNLLVLDSAGRPVQNYGWSLHIDRGSSSEYTGQAEGRRDQGRASVAVPNYPFELEVRAPGFNDKTAGSFPAGPLPEVVEVKLDAPRGVMGSVTFNGMPVADCYVELVAKEPDYLDGVLGDRWSGLYYGWKGTNARTDGQGRFMIASDFPHMEYYVRAWKEGHADGMAGPTSVGGDPIAIELGTGGGIRGEITVAAPGSPEGIEVEVYRRMKEPTDLQDHVGTQFTVRVGLDGRFEFGHLVPGPWLLHLKIGGTVANRLGYSAEQVAAYDSIPWVVDVVEGGSTASPIDLARADVCRLDGRIQVGNKISEGYCKLLLEGPVQLDVAFGGIDRGGDGKFTLATRTPGKYRVVINAGPGHYQYKVITDLVDLAPGLNAWEKNLTVDRWEGAGIRLDQK